MLTQIRVGRSHLEQHKFTIGLADSPVCQCFFPSETTEHYFLQCFLYSPERRILFDLIEHHVPNFLHFNNKQKIDILLNGIRTDDPDLFYLNKTLTIAVQQFIIATKRFVDWTSFVLFFNLGIPSYVSIFIYLSYLYYFSTFVFVYYHTLIYSIFV